jgi:hypothetical protein
MAGGPAIIILAEGAPRPDQLQLCIEGREPISLDIVGACIAHGSERIVLIAYDLQTGQAFEPVPSEEETFRPVPIFSKPGEVNLSLRAKDRELGTLTLTVTSATQEAGEVRDLFYPKFVVDQRGDPNKSRWPLLLVDTTWQGPAPIDAALLQTLKNDLPVISQHPDWAEIAKFLVAYREAQAVADDITLNRIKATRGEPTSRPAELSEWAQGVFASQPSNRFAQAVKARMRCQMDYIQGASP